MGSRIQSLAARARWVRAFAALLAALIICGTSIALAAQDDSEPPQATAQLSDGPGVPSGPELESKRTATSKTFRLPNGSFETRIYESPVRYRDAEGDWTPIDEGLEPAPQAADAALTNGENEFDVSLPARMGAGPVRIETGDAWVSSELTGPPSGPVQLEGKAASYEAADPGVNFVFSSLPNGLKEDIEIAGPSDPSTFGFELTASRGVAPILLNDGSIEFRDESEQLVASLPTPFMSDSAPAISHDVHYELDALGQQRWQLTVEADREWLEQPERVWPAVIDPTLTVPSPTLDCTITGSQGKKGSGICGVSGSKELRVDYLPSTTQADVWHRSLLSFDVSPIPASVDVTNATIGLYAPNAALNTSGVDLRGVTQSWGQTATWQTYNSYPDGTTLPWNTEGGDFSGEGTTILTSERGAQAGWWTFSGGLTSLAQRWVKKEIPNQGVLLKLKDDKVRECNGSTCTSRILAFNSSAATEAALRPYMAVTYYPPAPPGSVVTSPKEGTRTARRLRLQATGASAGATGVTFQFKTKDSGGFKTIPTNLVRNEQGQPVSWPLAVQSAETEPLYFDAVGASTSLQEVGGPVTIRALFDGPPGAIGYSKAVKAGVSINAGGTGDATTGVGPGRVNLMTGTMSVSRTDVSIGSLGSELEFSRSYNSGDTWAGGTTSVLGGGWVPNVPVEAAGGSEWRSVQPVVPGAEEAEEGIGEYALLTDSEGYEYAFELSGGVYVVPPEATGWVLTRSGNTFALTDPSGNRTTFENSSGSNEYLPISVSQAAASANSTRTVYQFVNGKRRLWMVIAPSAPGVTCPPEWSATTTLGCRVLTFLYKGASAWGAPASYQDRLYSVTYWGPASATQMGSWPVAQYGYDAQGRLVEQWDPRISPALKETYAYDGTARLKTIKPAGEEPWTLEYGPAEAQTPEGMSLHSPLVRVKRPSLLSSPTIAQTTIVYGVPLSGSGAPYDMSGSSVAKWGQQDAPLDATAIFPPDQIPASPPSDYSRASIYYMDGEGQLVNTATPLGAGTSAPSITTTEADEHGNVVRELSAQNRLRALAAGASSVERSHELETKRIYSTDGTEMLEEFGPLHQVRLESGSTTQARMHRVVKYDEGVPPSLTPKPHLPTLETSGASIPGQGVDVDKRVVATEYDWALRAPTDTIIDPAGLNLRTHVTYNSSGLPIERRLPGAPTGGTPEQPAPEDAHTTKTIYYTAGANPSDSACGNKPAWANLPCKNMPAAQPGTAGLPQLLVKRVLAYSPLAQPTEVTESPAGGTSNARKTITVYDTAGRVLNSKQEGNGTPIPKTQTLYSSTTGRPTTQRFVCETGCSGFDDQATTTTYDALGRPTTYEDADGNLSSTSYDLLGRPVTTSDGKGIQTRTYDPTSGLLVKLEDSDAGTFTASYDADGSLREQGLPNGLTAKTTYDETGSPVQLSYEKTSFCSLNCTWLDFEVDESIHGQWLAQTSNLSTQQYSYDKAGRLNLVKDTPNGGGCTTRSYSFDADSNRTKLVARAPGIGGACDTASAGATKNYGYDAADRLLGSGIVYDNYGRIESLPSTYSGGGTLTTTYYSNDLVKSQTQDGITNTYELDGALRQHQRTQAGGSNPGTEVYHYAGGSDSPAWIDRGSSWERNVVGIDGGLAAIQNSSSGTTLQLTNLHGDIVATASTSPEATKLLATFEFDEFGNPKQSGGAKYGWLGGKQRRTELPSGLIQMGVRSYVPAMGRFVSADPLLGGSSNAYDYANADPMNTFDLDGARAKKRKREVAKRAGAQIYRASVAERRTKPVAMTRSQPITPLISAARGPGSCIPLEAMSPRLRSQVNNGCIRKLVVPRPMSPSVVAADYLVARAYCVALNTGIAGANLLSFIAAQAWCGREDGGVAWAYVRATG